MAVETPSWWSDRGIINTNNTAQDRAAANQGQLKYVAARATEELQDKLTNTTADLSVIIGLTTNFSSANNRAAVNLGQLKYIAKPYYDILQTNNLTFAWPENMAEGPYPWSESTNHNTAIANIGQLKHVFSFDLGVDLDVDTDRDGNVEDNDEDEIGEDEWTSKKGAIYNVNFDGDGNRLKAVKNFGEVVVPDAIYFNDDGKPTHEDYTIENEEDAKDIAPLVIRGIPTNILTNRYVFLKVEGEDPEVDIKRIHVYKEIASDENSIWGSMTTNEPAYEPAYTETEINITEWVSTDDVTFGIEGLSFRNLVTNDVIKDYQYFDGVIDFTLELRDGTHSGANVICSDSVQMKVAPWMMISAAKPSEEVWTTDINPPPGTNKFLRTSDADAGYFGLDASGYYPEGGQLTILGNDVSMWVQDGIETGFTQRPGGPPTYIIFQLPYSMYGGTKQWHHTELLTTNMGIFQLGQDLDESDNGFRDLADHGGNMEILPPDDVNQLGTIEVGYGDYLSERLMCFLESQQVQNAQFNVDLNYLSMGHLAEIAAFWKDETTNVVIIADPTTAWELLENAPTDSVFFATGTFFGTVSSSNNIPYRIYTGIDHTDTNSPAWNYIRIYSSTNTNVKKAVGNTWEITGYGTNYVTVSKLWRTYESAKKPESSYIRQAYVTTNWDDFAPQKGDKYVLCEDSKWRYDNSSQNTPWIVTVAELLDNKDFEELNTNLMQEQLNAASNALAGVSTNLVFKKVPNLFFGEFDTTTNLVEHSCSTFNPAPAVMQAINGHLYMPRQFGPRNADGEDIFENAMASTLGGTNIVSFVDCWKYHQGGGGIQCGTEVRRSIPETWWDPQP